MKDWLKISGLVLALLVISGCAGAAEVAQDEKCVPSQGDLNFLCGIKKPEDLAALPGGRWLVASGMSKNSGLHLVDNKTKEWKRWIAPVAEGPTAAYDNCPSQPLPNDFRAHGVHLRDHGQGHATLYVVNHGGPEEPDFVTGRGRESIEVFEVNMTGAMPALRWTGCVLMPGKLVANSVVAGPDGSIFATVLLHPDKTMAELWKGLPTGSVYKWTPETGAFERLSGTELPGNNGIEISLDGKTLYVMSLSAVTTFTNSQPATKLKHVENRGVIGDNIHWVNGRLMVAGARTDLCPPLADGAFCMAGYRVSIVDPESLQVSTMVDGPANSQFVGTSAAILVGNTLWLGSHSDDKLAYRVFQAR